MGVTFLSSSKVEIKNGEWVSNDLKLNAKYFISNVDRSNGSVTFYLTSTGNTSNTCNPVQDSVRFVLLSNPNVLAGTDQNVCYNIDTVYLSGSITGSVTTGTWSSSGTGFFVPNNTTQNANVVTIVMSLETKPGALLNPM